MARKYCVILQKESVKHKMCHIMGATELKKLKGRFPPKKIYQIKEVK